MAIIRSHGVVQGTCAMNHFTPLLVNVHYGAPEVSFHFVAGVICAAIAASKSRSVLGWFLIGAILSCFGVLIALCMSDLTPIRLMAGETTRGHAVYTRISSRRARRPDPVPPIPPDAVGEEPLEWYWSENGAPAGPVTRSAIRTLHRHGTIDGETLVWRRGFADWRPYRQCGDLR